jgi:hypothetical protein
VVIQVLDELQCVLKEDTGLDLNVSKNSRVILPKGTTHQVVFDVSHIIIYFFLYFLKNKT